MKKLKDIFDSAFPKYYENKMKQKKFCGSKGWLIFWIIMFAPMAIVYWAIRQE